MSPETGDWLRMAPNITIPLYTTAEEAQQALENDVVRQPMHQASLPGMSLVEPALEKLAEAGIEERGAIFTKREVVDFILDLAGYTTDKALHRVRLLEPSFGEGDFLLPAIERLLQSWRHHDTRRRTPVTALRDSMRGVELHRATFRETRTKVVTLLLGSGVSAAEADALATAWLTQGDFLLTPFSHPFDVVVGNPPYVRQELIPDALIEEYRTRYQTIYDRADLYVPFIERSLTLLATNGALGFICADRWMKNRYGKALRLLVAERFHLKVYVDMVDTPAFHSEVMAYPAIIVITNEQPGKTRIARRPAINRATLSALSTQLLGNKAPPPDTHVKEIATVAAGAEPWILESFDQLALVRRLEGDFPPIEQAGCKVGIGVATGADKVFIGPFDELDVETDRKLPLVTTRDIVSGEVKWRGLGVINPFAADGSLVPLAKYPRLKRYLERNKDLIAKRHVAQKAPRNWYRTIDRIYPDIATTPKLLIPDIKGEAHIVHEDGRLYPHHNLYYITSDEWDLKALRAVLTSGIARLFVSIYSTKMRGGYLRFQAQYLRRIRLPRWADVPQRIRTQLAAAAEDGDVAACNRAAFALYKLTAEERSALGGNGD